MDTQQHMMTSASPQDHASMHDPTHPYAFLVHSQSTLDRNLPPKVDNKMLARQKRRRTSPEDHAILETEYQKNSKPDKAARAEIVKKVALEEKAVQIWFQNRRQNDRRKSRPLLPHELIPHLRNPPSSPFLTSSFDNRAVGILNTSPSFEIRHEEPSSPSETSPPVLHSPVEERAPSRGSSIHDLLNPANENPTPAGPAPVLSRSASPSSSPTTNTDSLHSVNVSTQTTSHEVEPLQEKSPNTTASGSISRKRTIDDMESKENVRLNMSTTTSFISSQERSSSVRLSMSLDGAVKVKTTEEDTPSPPKQRAMAPNPDLKRVGGLQRSKSEVGMSQAAGEETSIQPRPSSGIFGRSRDARTWEFYCDSDARDALAVQAERERSGSALGAISLIRSRSKKSKENLKAQHRREALHPKSGAGNTQKSSSTLGKKPKLSRAQSSMGRLQHEKSIEKAAVSSKATRPSHIRTGSESDKENWAPGTRASDNALRRTQPSSNPRGILKDNSQSQSHSTSLIGAIDSDRKRARTAKRGISIAGDANKENANGEPLDIAAFMKANGASGTEKEDDLDCIQGLLSLSQGAWR